MFGKRIRRRARGGQGPLLPWLVGSLLAAVAAYALTIPLWRDRVEGLAVDFLFRYGRLDPPRADPRIVHVDIDDSTLDSFGRWPWRRSLVAKAIQAIDACEPGVIALDILFDEPDLDRPEEDASLIAAIAGARAPVIVATKFPPQTDQSGSPWRSAEGAAALRRVLEALRADITLDPDRLVEQAALDESLARRVRAQFQSFRRMAIEEEVRAVDDPADLSIRSMRTRMIPANKRNRPYLGLEMMMGKVIDGVKSERFIGARSASLSRSGVVPVMDRLEAPLIGIVEAARAAAFVTAETDRDGVIRRMPPVVAFAGHLHPQLGVAAAMAYFHTPTSDNPPTSDITLLENAVRIARTTVPVNAGRSLIVWPRIEEGSGPLNLLTGRAWRESQNAAFGLLRQSPDDLPTHGHISLSGVLDLHMNLEKVRLYHDLSRDIIRDFFSRDGDSPEDWDNPTRRPQLAKKIQNEVQFHLALEEGGKPEDPGADASDLQRVLWVWHDLDAQVPAAEPVLRTAEQNLLRSIRGRIVFVGFVATGSLTDVYPTAAGPRTPGVVVNAMMANMILTGETVREAPLWLGALLTFALGSFAAFVGGIRSIRPLLGLVLACVIVFGWVVTNALLLFDLSHVFVPLATPLAGIVLGLFGSTFSRGLDERRERQRLLRQFGHRIHRRLFDYLIEHPEALNLSGAQREVTCLFGDLAGFTSVSETMDSRSTVALLNRYMGGMHSLLTDHSAYVNKFLGDGLMAFWGAFEEDSTHADRAVRAAIACIQRVEELNFDAARDGHQRLSMRFGLCSGPVTVGDCGAPPEFSDFTVIGDSVNLAARLESANKQFGTSILINARTNEMLGPEVLRRPVGLVTVVGQSKPVEVFEVLPVEPGTADEELHALVRETTQAVRLYRDRRLDEAAAAWTQLIERHGQSRLAALYLAEIARFRANADDLFDGVIRLSTK